MTRYQREILLEHIDRPDGIAFRIAGSRSRVIRSLLDRGLLYGDRRMYPRRTFATEAGRQEIGRALGAEADGLLWQYSGDKHPRAKMTTQEVVALRKMHADGASIQILVEAFPNISRSWIRKIVNGVAWKRAPKRFRERAEYMRDYRKKNGRPSRAKQEHANG